MFYKGFFKRIIPFFLTFSAGLFIASLFVPLSMPNLRMPSPGSHKYRELNRLKMELDETRRENRELKKENQELRRNVVNFESGVFDGVPPVIEAPVPPPPPKAPRAPKSDYR